MKKPHFFEIFALTNLLAVAVAGASVIGQPAWPLQHLLGFAVPLSLQFLAGVAIRSVVAKLRGDRAWFRTIRTRAWQLDSLRLLLGGSVMITTYAAIKLIVPLLNKRSFDSQLWAIDQALFGGAAPTVLFLDLFDVRTFLVLIDASYAGIFALSSAIGVAYFLSHRSRRVRVAFSNGNAFLWITGAWVYVLVPSLGPAYRFPDIWFAHAETLRVTQTLQALLMRNYQNVLREAAGLAATHPISIVLGIGAFPSLHVGFQMYLFLWSRRLWKGGELIFGIFVVTIFLGSMITGWHYFIDGVGGIVLAAVSYRLFSQRARLARWIGLGRALSRAH